MLYTELQTRHGTWKYNLIILVFAGQCKLHVRSGSGLVTFLDSAFIVDLFYQRVCFDFHDTVYTGNDEVYRKQSHIERRSKAAVSLAS